MISVCNTHNMALLLPSPSRGYGFLIVVVVVVIVALGRAIHATSPTATEEEFLLGGWCPKGMSDASGDISIKKAAMTMEGQGQHRTLRYRFEYDDRVQHWIDSSEAQTRELAIVHTLPAVWFVDPFEQKRVTGVDKANFTSHIVGAREVDLESIESLSRPVEHVLAGHVRVAGPDERGMGKRTDVDVGVKVHARYASVSGGIGEEREQRTLLEWLLSDTTKATFEPIAVVVRSPTGHCRRLMPRLERVLETELPAGAMRHAELVRWGSTAAVVVAAFVVSGARIVFVSGGRYRGTTVS